MQIQGTHKNFEMYIIIMYRRREKNIHLLLLTLLTRKGSTTSFVVQSETHLHRNIEKK